MSTAVNVGDIESVAVLTDQYTPVLDRIQAASEAAFAKIEASTVSAKGALEDLVSSVGNVGAAVGIGFGVSQIVSFTESVIATGHEAEIMASKIDVSVESVQRLSYAADMTGTSIDSVSTGIVKMQQNLENAAPKAIASINDLGLSTETLLSMQPDQAFYAIAAALQAVPDPAKQAADAVNIFGRGAKDLLPGIRQGFEDIANEAPVMSDSTVKSLADAERAWKSLSDHVVVASGTVLSVIMKMLTAQQLSDDQQAISEMVMHEHMTVEEATAAVTAAHTKVVQAFVGPVQQMSAETLTANVAFKAMSDTQLPLTAAMKESITTMLNSGMALKEVEKDLQAAGVDTSQYKQALVELDAEHTQNTQKEQAHKQAIEDLNAALMPLNAAETARIQIALDWFTVGGRLTVSEKTIADAYGFSEAAVKAVSLAEQQRSLTNQALDKLAQQTHDTIMKRFTDEEAAQQKQADASAKNLADMVVKDQDANKQFQEDFLTTDELRIAKMQDAEDKEIKSLGLRTAANATYYDDAKAKITAHYDYLKQALSQNATDEQKARDQATVDWDGYYVALAKLHGSHVMDAELQQVKDGLQQQVDALDHSKPDFAEKYDNLVAMAGVRMAEIAQSYHDKAVQPMIDDTTKTLYDGIMGGWSAMKKDIEGILSSLLQTFLKDFVTGIINGALGATNAWSSAFSNISGWYQSLTGQGNSVISLAGRAMSAIGAASQAVSTLSASVTTVSGITGGTLAGGTAIPGAVTLEGASAGGTAAAGAGTAAAIGTVAAIAGPALLAYEIWSHGGTGDPTQANDAIQQQLQDAYNQYGSDPNNPTTYDLLAAQYGQQGYASGTQGQFVDFGAGTRVTLHGKEAVVTQADSAMHAQKLDAMHDTMRAVITAQRDLPRALALALKTAGSLS